MAEVGPEVISGSTRMKAGTAQKMILNTLSSGAMIRMGYVYDNLMINLHLRNSKLRERGAAILQRAAGVSRKRAEQALADARHSLPTALIMLKSALRRPQAEAALKAASGNVRRAIVQAQGRPAANHLES